MPTLPRRILVPVDFDRGSRRALRYARALAAASGAEIALLHVIAMPAGHPETKTDRWWKSLAVKTLAGVADSARLPPGTRTDVVAGDVAMAISKYACDEAFDLIILSGRHRPDWHGSLLGTTATAILRHARVPVLVVPSARGAWAVERRSA
jgi:universal stress protein F